MRALLTEDEAGLVPASSFKGRSQPRSRSRTGLIFINARALRDRQRLPLTGCRASSAAFPDINEWRKPMTSGMKHALAVLPLIATLVACGGGGNDGGTEAVNPATTTGDKVDGTIAGNAAAADPGKVEEPFLKLTTLRYLAISATSQATGAVVTWDQQPAGGVVAINDNTLTGPNRSVLNVAGDETWGQGRWAGGSAVIGGRSTVLGTASNGAFHYVVFNQPISFPTSGKLTCDGGQFTAPNVLDAATGEALGLATGTAALSFADDAAVADLSITVTARSVVATSSTKGLALRPGSTPFTGGFAGQGDGMMLTLGDAGNGKFRLIAGYQVTDTRAGASYRGVATFLCSN
ncbi:hypothetical protein ACQ86G_15740 [Roseateles chitinivorans]|uniref:hypothetical protein n=1 Tax=Roseateles chitinivorans TaxID=2917965 RepID=UPI003D67A1F4